MSGRAMYVVGRNPMYAIVVDLVGLLGGEPLLKSPLASQSDRAMQILRLDSAWSAVFEGWCSIFIEKRPLARRERFHAFRNRFRPQLSCAAGKRAAITS